MFYYNFICSLLAFTVLFNKYFNIIIASKKSIFLLKYFGKLHYNFYYNFLYDLHFRFSNKPLRSFEFYFLNSALLPIEGNIHLTKQFIWYRGLFITIGLDKYLPNFISYSGLQSSYIIMYSKISFWLNYYKSFNYLYNSLQNKFTVKFQLIKLIKFGLFQNYVKDLKWFIIQYNTGFFSFKLSKLLKIKYFLISSQLFEKNLLLFNNKLNFFIFYDYLYTNNINGVKFVHNKRNFNVNPIKKFFKKPLYWSNKRLRYYIKAYRLGLKRFFFLKGKQKSITKLAKKLYTNRSSSFLFLASLDLKLEQVLITAGFALSIEESRLYINQGMVFVNNLLCFNPLQKLSKSDVVQLIISSFCYLSYRYYLAEFITKSYKLHIYKNRKSSGAFFKLAKSSKSGSWIYKTLWLLPQFPKFLEVDYLTMSLVVLYNPIAIQDISPIHNKAIKVLNLRMYNWLYLN